MLINVDDFIREKECIYESEIYSVRDNGAVFRHQQAGKRLRPNDKQWTFGKTNSLNPYLHLSNIRIHRIVATAFHGEPPNPKYVVDHIDTNCKNNRPENLRWVTRLENTLMNPVTRKKIEYLCGSVNNFLENPSILDTISLDQNFEWMRRVTPEEAKNCKERMSFWANTNNKPKGGSLGEWVYDRIKKREIFEKEPELEVSIASEGNRNCREKTPLYASTNNPRRDFLDEPVYYPINEGGVFGRMPELVMALTKGCAQYKWRVPSYFPCCPEEIGENPLESYFQNIKVGSMFSYNDVYPKSTIIEFVLINNNSSILVMCEKDDLKPLTIAEITFESDLFIHSNLGTYFCKDGADKTFRIKQGLEWTGGDTFDDFC
jgi:hypothetical protein